MTDDVGGIGRIVAGHPLIALYMLGRTILPVLRAFGAQLIQNHALAQIEAARVFALAEQFCCRTHGVFYRRIGRLQNAFSAFNRV